MSSQAFIKAQKREIRRLCGVAYERELSAAAAALAADFDRWRSGEIDVFELAERIHKFHDGEQRELYKMYAMADPFDGVRRGVNAGVLTKADADPAVYPHAPELQRLFEPSVEG